jgi:hypothetical protein
MGELVGRGTDPVRGRVVKERVVSAKEVFWEWGVGRVQRAQEKIKIEDEESLWR